MGAAGHARGRQPARLADDRGAHARDARRAGAFAEQVATRATTTSCCSAWAAPRSRPRCCVAASTVAPTGRRLHVLDSTDADAIRAVQAAVDLERTLFFVSSKSGGTIEPLSLFAHFYRSEIGQQVGEGRSFVAITDPGSGLAALAQRTRIPQDVPRRPEHRRALQRAVAFRDRPGGADGRRRGRAARRARARRGRRRSWTPNPSALKSCGGLAGSRTERARTGRAQQADVRDRAVAARAGPVAGAARRRVDRQARHAASCPSPRSRSASRATTARIACSPTCPTRTPARRELAGAHGRRWRTPGTR